MSVLRENLWIGGKSRAASNGATATLVEPSRGENLAEVAEGTVDDVRAAVGAATDAFNGPWRRVTPRERGRILLRLSSLIRERLEDLARLESRNVGKPIRDARDEVGLAADTFEYYGGAVNKIGGQTLPASANGTLLTFREPIGVCGVIVPWNFPIAITSWKVAPALAMGNTIVLKPAEQTPLTALKLAELALEAGIPEGVFNVVTGKGSVIGNGLVRDPRVRKVGFTGSTEVGREVMRLAAEDIKRVTLELGGKSANLVFADADLDRSVASATSSVLGNAGQDCCARSRLLVHRSIHDEFVGRLQKRFSAVRVGEPLDEETEMGPLVTRAHLERVKSYVAAGREEGAQLICGGDAPEGEAFARGAWLRPTIFDGATADMKIVREEIFGPVLAVMTFDSEEEAIRLANDSVYGLSGSIWTRDIARALRVARAVETGVLSINSGSSVHLEAPFGGFKQSGIGRELGMTALDHYSEMKSVFISGE